MKSYGLKLKTIFIVILFCGMLGLTRSSWAANYYVMPAGGCAFNGNGSVPTCANSGGATGAWNGFNNILWNSLKGNTLNLVGGQTYRETMYVMANATKATQESERILITVAGPGPAVIDSENGTRSGFMVNDADYITIDGGAGNAIAGDYTYKLKVINLGVDSPTSAYACYYNNGGTNAHNVFTRVECSGTLTAEYGEATNARGTVYAREGPFEASYLWIHGPASAKADHSLRWNVNGMTLFMSSSGAVYDFSKVHHNLIETIVQDGMDVSSNQSIHDNEIRYIGYNYPGWPTGSHSDSVSLESSQYSKVFNNYFHDNEGQNVYLDCLNGIESNNFIFNNLFVDIGIGMPIDAENSGTLIDNNHIFNNTFIKVYGGSISFGARAGATNSNLDIRNNIFGETAETGWWQLQGGPTGSPPGTITNTTLDYNIYMSGSSDAPNIIHYGATRYDLTSARRDQGWEMHGNYANPAFVGISDYRLAAQDSVAKGKGIDLTSYCATVPELCFDKNGVARPNGTCWDIGAYEYVQGGDTTPPAAPTGLRVN